MQNEAEERSRAFNKVFAGLPRQGPGGDEQTLKALNLLPPIAPHARIFDLGCGTGRASVVLAQHLQQRVISVDLSKSFLADVQTHARKLGVDNLIETRCADMGSIAEENETIDLIWSEGAIYCIGFDKGLQYWHQLLKPSGIIACTELSWISSTPSPEAAAFWQENYPAMRSVSQNLDAITAHGYSLLGNFTLPKSCWWNEYYGALLTNIKNLAGEAKENKYLQAVIENVSAEIDLHKNYGEEYSYEFYIMQKSR